MKKNSEYQFIFMIPNELDHGAQNFFRRLKSSFNAENKLLFIESKEGNFINRVYKIFTLSRNKKVVIFSTVNSNKLSLIIKILIPSALIIPRLGNTISLELKKNSLKYIIHKFFYFCLIKASTKFIFQSQLMMKDFLIFFNFKENEKFTVVHNGISKKESLKDLPSISKKSNASIFLLVGTFKFQKGYDIFFHSLNHICKKVISNIEFHICGDGSEFDKWINFMHSHQYKEKVFFHGMTDPALFYKNADAYILPSRFEGFSNSLIEALSFGLPCIVSDCPSANREVIKENFNGIFFDNLDSEDLASKIENCYESLESFDKKNIQVDLFDRFSIENISNKYMKLIM